MKSVQLALILIVSCASAAGQVALFPGAGGYFEDFESGPAAWAPGTGSTGTGWQHGTPAASTINTAFSGSNVFMTDLVNSYVDNSLSYVEALFDFTAYAGFGDPILSMQLWYDTETGWDGVAVEINTGGGFVPVGVVGDPGWYNDTDVDGIANDADGWSGGSGSWIQVSHALDGVAGNQATIRVVFGSDASISAGFDGVAIDDVTIMDAPIPLYPGTNEDFEASLNVNLGGPVTVAPGTEQVQIAIGDYVEYNCISPGGTFTGLDLIVVGSFLPTGIPIAQLFPGLHVEPSTVFLVNRGIPGVLPLLPSGGFNVAFVHPGGSLTGLSVYFQSLISTPIAFNGIFAGTNALEMQML